MNNELWNIADQMTKLANGHESEESDHVAADCLLIQALNIISNGNPAITKITQEWQRGAEGWWWA